MSRFGPDRYAFFKSVYEGAAPWEISGIQPAMETLIEQFPRAITEDELRSRFTEAAGWRVLYVASAEFLNTAAAPTAAIAACGRVT